METVVSNSPNYVNMVIGILGGLAVFLWGKHIMADGLQKGAGDKLRFWIEKLTKTPYHGALVGTVSTAVVHSSSAITILCISFVDTGLMNLSQAMGIIFGANVGTTFTAQLIAFRIDWIIMPCIIIGIALKLFSNSKKWLLAAEIILGFGILFLGMKFLNDAVYGIKDSKPVTDFLVVISKNLYLGILAGTIFSALIQSSTATSAMCIILISNGYMTVPGGIAVMMGANIGTCITGQIAAIGTSFSAQRVAIGNTIFNVLGVLVFIPLIESGIIMKGLEWMSVDPTRQLANFHTFFNIASTIVILPFTSKYVKFIEWVLKGKDEKVEYGIKFITDKLVQTPSLAMEQATQEIVRMLEIARQMVFKSKDIFLSKNRKNFKIIMENEDVVDSLQMAITSFLSKLTQKSLSEDQANRAVVLINAVHDVERIGDHATNLAELAQGVIESNVNFSDDAKDSLLTLYDTVNKACLIVKDALANYDVSLAQKMNNLEFQIDDQVREMRNAHITRLKTEVCKPEYGIFYLDMASNLERVGDHCLNISQAVSGEISGVTHKSFPGLDPS